MRTPAFAERQQFLHRRQAALFVGVAKTVAHAKIIRRQNIVTAQLKDQQHFNRPAAHPANFREPLDDFVVGQFHDLPRRRHDAGQGFRRDVANRGNLGEGKSAGANLCVGHARQIFRPGNFVRETVF